MSNQAQTYNDEQIIAGCMDGDRKFQELLYKRFANKMFPICLRYAGENNLAQDILQEGFIKIFRFIGQFKHTGSFEGWIRRIFVNVSLEALRKRSTMYVVQETELNHVEHASSNGLDALQAEDILDLVASLSDGYRTVFNLYVVEGFSHKEIAEMLNINEGTSKSQLARAKMILQKKIETKMTFNITNKLSNYNQ
jgi:RNA polymerase sigma factor (sigma-70 family)